MLVYLGSPYTASTLAEMEERFKRVCQEAADLMNEGYEVFSPIVHSHPLADYMDPKLRTDHDFWMRQDLAILKHADFMYVLQLPGWTLSRGLKREMEFATDNGIPVIFREPRDCSALLKVKVA